MSGFPRRRSRLAGAMGLPPRRPARNPSGGDVPAHVPVLADAVLAALAPRDDALYVDGTFGAGGYSAALLAAARCRVVAIDRDPDAVAARPRSPRKHGGRLDL